MMLAFVVAMIITYYNTYNPLEPQSLQTSVSENNILDKCTPDHELNHVKRSLFNLYWIASRWAGTFVFNDWLSGEFPSSFDHRLIEHHVQTCVVYTSCPRGGGGGWGVVLLEILGGGVPPGILTRFQTKKDVIFHTPFTD